MILSLFILLLNFPQQDTIPYKPNTDFELIFYYELKEHRDGTGSSDEMKKRFPPVYWGDGSGKKSSYFTVDLKVKKLSADEVRYRIVDSTGKPGTSQKVQSGNTIHLTFGFIEDMKNGVTPNGYKITFTSRKKVDISQIEIRVLDDGAYIVNGEYRLFLPHGF